jgi:hypothetical protein
MAVVIHGTAVAMIVANKENGKYNQDGKLWWHGEEGVGVTAAENISSSSSGGGDGNGGGSSRSELN